MDTTIKILTATMVLWSGLNVYFMYKLHQQAKGLGELSEVMLKSSIELSDGWVKLGAMTEEFKEKLTNTEIITEGLQDEKIH